MGSLRTMPGYNGAQSKVSGVDGKENTFKNLTKFKMKDTIRIILFLECNMRCSYCCNEQEQVNSQFTKLHFDEIDFSKYKNVCISGGEPFLNRDLLFNTLYKIPAGKKIFIYTNGTLVKDYDIYGLMNMQNLKGINVGL